MFGEHFFSDHYFDVLLFLLIGFTGCILFKYKFLLQSLQIVKEVAVIFISLCIALYYCIMQQHMYEESVELFLIVVFLGIISLHVARVSFLQINDMMGNLKKVKSDLLAKENFYKTIVDNSPY